ncbi:hypothetical protein M422DRAFT_265475 [Sphaerobolus stellatus SS14]|uniref:Uncharacterized protein n=1 Tax=Sphaerobolus stellatus (strain SS14) TaxID=990650 RepID=A0A0C9UTZ2_SPHS4|nr:hypothetical protein M422DRAFT_265475 [Sphaerobolus stellatus SS14]
MAPCAGRKKEYARSSSLKNHEAICLTLLERRQKADRRRLEQSDRRRRERSASPRRKNRSRHSDRSYERGSSNYHSSRGRSSSHEHGGGGRKDSLEFLQGSSHNEIQDSVMDMGQGFLPYSVIQPEVISPAMSPPPPPPPPPPPVLERGYRQKRRTIKLRDDYPSEGPAPLPAPEEMQPAEDPELEMVPSTVTRRFLQLVNNIRLILVQKFWTKGNTFGLSRLYYGNPSRIPDEFTSTADMATAAVNSQPLKAGKDGMLDAIWPYPNISSWRLGINNVLLAKDFKLEDIQNVAWDKINDLLAQISPNAPEGEGWVETSVDIELPTGIKKKAGERPQNNHRAANFFSVPGLWHRSIPALISSVFSGDTAAEIFHFNPFKQFWIVCI